MERIGISLLLIFTTEFFINSFPIKNGFSVKFNPVHTKEDLSMKAFGALFAKIPQALKEDAQSRRQNLAKTFLYPPISNLGTGCTNQIARIIFPLRQYYYRNSSGTQDVNFITLPIIQQPYKNYKILVATAPQHMKISKGDDAKPVVIYVIFPDDGVDAENGSFNIPSVYFINRSKLMSDNFSKADKGDPVIIINNNRTVTGLKSKGLSKFLKFRNKLINRVRDKYEVEP